MTNIIKFNNINKVTKEKELENFLTNKEVSIQDKIEKVLEIVISNKESKVAQEYYNDLENKFKETLNNQSDFAFGNLNEHLYTLIESNLGQYKYTYAFILKVQTTLEMFLQMHNLNSYVENDKDKNDNYITKSLSFLRIYNTNLAQNIETNEYKEYILEKLIEKFKDKSIRANIENLILESSLEEKIDILLIKINNFVEKIKDDLISGELDFAIYFSKLYDCPHLLERAILNLKKQGITSNDLILCGDDIVNIELEYIKENYKKLYNELIKDVEKTLAKEVTRK